jgi:hypothetical protein
MMIRLKCCKTLAFSLTAATLVFALGGCGYKDNPVPPQQVIPKAITDLRYQLNDKGVTLSWSYPVETITGSDITEISSFDVYRAVIPVEEYCDSCPIPFGRPINQPGGPVPDEGRKTATYESTLLRPGNMYLFKVRSTSGWWATSEDSNVVSFLWNIPAKAPENLQAHAADAKITLNWQPVSSHRDGTELSEDVMYQVYRSMGGGAFQAIGEPVSATHFVDTTVRNGRKYFYKIQSLSIYEKATVGGGETDVVAAESLDRTPPAPPVGVHVVRTAKAMKIFWEPVNEKDLKGYRVYRRLSGEKKMTMVGEVNAPYIMFTDQAPPKDALQIFYAVSSIDTQDPANESIRSPEVMIKP